MSKKFNNRRRQKKRTISTPVFILMFGGALLLAGGIILGFQQVGGGTPALAVDEEVIDYGEVKLNTDLTFAVRVTNTGDGTLRFREEPYIKVRKGC